MGHALDDDDVGIGRKLYAVAIWCRTTRTSSSHTTGNNGQCLLSREIVRGGLGRLTRARWAGWSAFRWAATSNVEVGQTTFSAKRERVRMEGREGTEGQRHKEEEKEGWSGTGEGPETLGYNREGCT